LSRISKAAPATALAAHARRTVFALLCLCGLGLVAFLGRGVPSAGAAASFPGQGFLPDHRAWEMVSPPDKNGGAIAAYAARTHVAADCDSGSCAVAFASTTGFADARSNAIGTEYIAVRDPSAGQNGWSTHGIVPPQQPLTYLDSPTAGSGEPRYLEFSPDLDTGIFRSYSPVTDERYVEKVPDLYTATGLLAPGAATFGLQSACPRCLATDTPLAPWNQSQNTLAMSVGHSADFRHVAFESTDNLTPDSVSGTAKPLKAYESDEGVVRLLGLVPAAPATACGAQGPACVLPAGSGANKGGSNIGGGSRKINQLGHSPVSADGSRVVFQAPTAGAAGIVKTGSPAGRSNLYQRDSHGTATTADDTTTQLNASERIVPAEHDYAAYGTESTDGHRVFFTSRQPLTDEAPSDGRFHLYMWHDDYLDNEVQSLSVAADSGRFHLLFGAQETAALPYDASAAEVQAALETLPGIGAGDVKVDGGPGDALASSPYAIEFLGSLAATDEPTMAVVPEGLAAAGDASLAPVAGLPAQARLRVIATAGTFTLAYAGQATSPLPYNASAAEVQSALDALATIGGAGAGVSVGGGPGDGIGSVPYEISFGGALAGEPVSITADGSGLTGGAALVVPRSQGGGHLTLIDVDREPADFTNSTAPAVLGASADGHYLYFTAPTRLLPDAPAFAEPQAEVGIYLWHDGQISYVGRFTANDAGLNEPGGTWEAGPGETPAQVSPDGMHLLFRSRDGAGLPTAAFPDGYDQGTQCEGFPRGCVELYVYDAGSGRLQCASCDPSGALPVAGADIGPRGITFGVMTVVQPTDRNLSSDGRFVFFTTPEALVPEDTDGVADAYEYDTATGTPHLLSSGLSPARSYFLSASADGHDAIIATTDRLSAWDVDGAYDLYDARVDGGIPEPSASPPACQGEACRPLPAASPAPPAPVSSSFQGPGDARARAAARRCPKGKHKLRRKGKVRCVARQHRKARHRKARHSRHSRHNAHHAGGRR
jgi:hypothetical protein